MKSLTTIFTVLSCFIFLAFVSCEKEIKPNNAPQEIKSYVSNYFPDCEIKKITREKEKGKKSYDVTLDCGVNLEFEDNNPMQMVDVDSDSKLPDAIIPQPILDYVNSNYQNSYIIGWEFEAKKTLQHVDLNTKEVLEFNMNHEFIRVVEID